MKKYIWNNNLSAESFFEKLAEKTNPSTFFELWNHWDEDCFIMKRKSKSRFSISFHRAFIRNNFARSLNGRILQTSQGIEIKARFQLNVLVIIFMIVWYLIAIPIFILILIASISLDPQNLLSLFVSLLLLVLPTLSIVFLKGKTEKIINLMNEICNGDMVHIC